MDFYHKIKIFQSIPFLIQIRLGPSFALNGDLPIHLIKSGGPHFTSPVISTACCPARVCVSAFLVRVLISFLSVFCPHRITAKELSIRAVLFVPRISFEYPYTSIIISSWVWWWLYRAKEKLDPIK